MNRWREIRTDLDRIYDALCDEESRQLFDARVAYMLDQDGEAYAEEMCRLNGVFPKKWRCRELEGVLEPGQEIVIYGCGHDGKILKRELELCGYSVAYWCSGHIRRLGTEVEGIKVISPEELAARHRESLVIIGSRKYETELRRRLFDVGFPPHHIFQFAYEPGIGQCGNQYFDVFSPEEREIFVDAGAYDGDSLEGFLRWADGREYKAYALETSAYMCGLIEAKRIPNVEVVNRAAWNCEEALASSDTSQGSNVFGIGDKESELYGAEIDSIVDGGKVTFIKMDIEGAELKALEGAKNTIERYHPKLDICIYHRPTDIYDIGRYILKLNPDYKLCIRHYKSYTGETVLYAEDREG